MSTGAIVAIIVVIAIIAALLTGFAANSRRRRLRDRFGPEYERAVSTHDSRREAEAELARRERRVAELDIRPLTPTARAQYSSEWTAVQEQFVESPQAAVAGAQALVAAVMRDRGYPIDTYDQAVADLSVEHAATLDHFRAAHDISERAGAGAASTEDLRRAMIHYRALFAELLGQPPAGQGDATAGRYGRQPAPAEPAPAEPASADPVSADPVSADPVSADPVPAQPASAGLAAAGGRERLPGGPAAPDPAGEDAVAARRGER